MARTLRDTVQSVTRKGMNRRVFLIGDYVIKFPRIVDDQTFVRGMLHNVLESVRWKLSRKHPALMPVIWCAPLGLMLIQRRCYYILYRQLTPNEVRTLPFTVVDNNGHNAGIHNNRIVVYDYGDENMHLVIDNG